MSRAGEILITGAAGFIGSNLTRALIERGHRVIGLDNLSMGSISNLDGLFEHPRFRLIKADVTDLSAVLRASHQCDTIVHLAAYKIPRYGGLLDTLRINEAGGRNVLDAARQNGAHVVMASTSDVYGKSDRLPFREDGPTVLGTSASARWGYAVSKLFDEHLAFAYHEAYGVNTTIIRIFGSYGPNQHLSWWGGPQSVFISAILRGKPIEIHGDGRQTRTFCYISDTVQGFVSAIEREATQCEIFNLGNTEEISIVDLATLIHSLSESPHKLELTYKPYAQFKNRYEDVMRRVPDISKAERILNYKPKVSLRDGLLKTIKWQRRRMLAHGLLDPQEASKLTDRTWASIPEHHATRALERDKSAAAGGHRHR